MGAAPSASARATAESVFVTVHLSFLNRAASAAVPGSNGGGWGSCRPQARDQMPRIWLTRVNPRAFTRIARYLSVTSIKRSLADAAGIAVPPEVVEMQTAVNVLAPPIVDNQRGTIIDRLNRAGLPAISQSQRTQRQVASPHRAVTDRLYPSCGTHYRSHHPRHSTDGDSGQAADQIRVGDQSEEHQGDYLRRAASDPRSRQALSTEGFPDDPPQFFRRWE